MHKHADGAPKIGYCMEICRVCELVKAKMLPYGGKCKLQTLVGEHVRFYIVGNLPPSYPDGYRCFCTFMHDYSREPYLAFFHLRSGLHDAFHNLARQFRQMKTKTPDL